ncbi:hypothetical protein QF031_002902 [Pseudarthrobacter defluvii]|uniref:GAF and ANTAR domain-containing protein n=1 Tax=Pseudarthrobacter defluvii TaxID=410837 RepID=UPI002783B66E|nr:GAF and ANTAR domain-containing protein [Pseudarthrobacter defluvii]MDQ0770153.1 hypothetical protein [Pseudarthrobacter defluvii]
MNDELTKPGTDVLMDMLLDSPDLTVFLQRLAQISDAELSREAGEGHCSVTVWRKRRPFTIASSGPEAAAMDELQYASNQGPCMEVAKTGRPVEVLDFRTETRWPRYVAAMAESPMRSVLAVPIALHTPDASAALNCYSPHPRHVPVQIRDMLLDFTEMAARALSLSVKHQTQIDLAADLAAAMQSRTAIDLAAGVIMAQTNCSQQEAVDIMITASSNRNEKLRDVALSVLARFDGSTPTTHFDSL